MSDSRKILCTNCNHEFEIDLSLHAGEIKCPECKSKIPKSEIEASQRRFEFVCSYCDTRFKIKASKLPRDSKFRIKCKKCQNYTVTTYSALLAQQKDPENESTIMRIRKNSQVNESQVRKVTRMSLDESGIVNNEQNESESSVEEKKSTSFNIRMPDDKLLHPAGTNEPEKPKTQTQIKIKLPEKPEPVRDDAPMQFDSETGKIYRAKVDKEIFGPLTMDELKKWADQGILKANDSIAIENGGFMKVNSVPDLRRRIDSFESGDVKSIKVEEEIENDMYWSFIKLIKSMGAGCVAGLFIALITVGFYFIGFRNATMLSLTPESIKTTAFEIIVQTSWWVIMGAFLGALFSFIELLLIQINDWIDVWDIKFIWLGALIGLFIGTFFFLLGRADILWLMYFVIYFLILNFLLSFSYRKFFVPKPKT